MAPPGSIPNPEVKHTSADGSVGSPHVRVGHHNSIIIPRAQARGFSPPDTRRPHPSSRIVRDNPHRPVRRMRTLRPRRVRRALCATIHIAPCAQGARYVRMMVRPRHVRRALCATIHTAPCAECARYHRMMLPPRHVRRASCATIHIAPCAECARYL